MISSATVYASSHDIFSVSASKQLRMMGKLIIALYAAGYYISATGHSLQLQKDPSFSCGDYQHLIYITPQQLASPQRKAVLSHRRDMEVDVHQLLLQK